MIKIKSSLVINSFDIDLSTSISHVLALSIQKRLCISLKQPLPSFTSGSIRYVGVLNFLYLFFLSNSFSFIKFCEMLGNNFLLRLFFKLIHKFESPVIALKSIIDDKIVESCVLASSKHSSIDLNELPISKPVSHSLYKIFSARSLACSNFDAS